MPRNCSNRFFGKNVNHVYFAVLIVVDEGSCRLAVIVLLFWRQFHIHIDSASDVTGKVPIVLPRRRCA